MRSIVCGLGGGSLVAISRGIEWTANDKRGREELGAIRAPGLFTLTDPDSSVWQERILKLYEQFSPSIYRYLKSLGILADEAEDLVQETFLRLAAHLREAGDNTNLRSWLFRVAHNLSMDIHRARRRGQSIADLDAENDLVDLGTNPESRYLKEEQLRRLDEAMSTLTSQQRNSILLRAEGLRYWEIASVLGVSEQRAVNLVKRGLLRLAKGV